jgi:hypothetical protein
MDLAPRVRDEHRALARRAEFGTLFLVAAVAGSGIAEAAAGELSG